MVTFSRAPRTQGERRLNIVHRVAERNQCDVWHRRTGYMNLTRSERVRHLTTVAVTPDRLNLLTCFLYVLWRRFKKQSLSGKYFRAPRLLCMNTSNYSPINDGAVGVPGLPHKVVHPIDMLANINMTSPVGFELRHKKKTSCSTSAVHSVYFIVRNLPIVAERFTILTTGSRLTNADLFC